MFRHYVAVALRNIRSAPLASSVNVVTLALGLVCFVTAYAAVVFWNTAEREFRNANDVYVLTIDVRNRDNRSTTPRNGLASPDVAAEALKADYPAITKIARAVVIDPKTTVASGERAVRLFGVAVDSEFLDIFDLPFVAGDARAALSSPRSAVITRGAAARLFGAENAIGKTIVIGNAIDATVTGVIDAIPEPSQFGRSASAPLPFDLLASRDVLDALRANNRSNVSGPVPPGVDWFRLGTITYLHLPPEGGLTPAALRTQLRAFGARHVPKQMQRNLAMTFGLAPVRDVLRDSQSFFGTGLPFASVLLVLGALVLGVACINYANLATARAATRVREVGVRKALGASTAQIAVQSWFDAAVLTLASLLVALAVFAAARPLVKDLLGANLGSTFFRTLGVWPALGLLVLAVTLAAGAYPALVLSRVRPVSAIAVGQTQLGSRLFSTLLVGTQFAVASFLLITLTVISMQNAEMRRSALSQIEDPLVVIDNPTNTTKVSVATLRERLSAVPQVRAVTEMTATPWESQFLTGVKGSRDPSGPRRLVVTRQVGHEFFNVFNVQLLAGRVFDRAHVDATPPLGSPSQAGVPAVGSAQTAESTAAAPSASSSAQNAGESPPVQNIVVDRSFVTAFGFGTPEEAVGKVVYRPTPAGAVSAPPPSMRIIGVVQDRSFSFFKAPPNAAGAMYMLEDDLEVTVARVAAADLDRGLKGIDAVWKELAPNVAVNRRFLDQIFDSAYSNYVRINHLFGTLSVMAFTICIAGLFGMATFVSGRRRREIGVRKTLGGNTRQMVALLLTGFAWPVLVANFLAWPAGYVAARVYLQRFSESIGITPLPFALSAAITLAIASVAVFGQTLRAARTRPAEVLRNE